MLGLILWTLLTTNLNKKFHTTLRVHFTWIYHNAQAVKRSEIFLWFQGYRLFSSFRCSLDSRFARSCFAFSFSSFFSRSCWLFFSVQCTFQQHKWVLCTVHGTYKFHFSATFSLKISLTALFTYLKIILLQCFQFSVFSKVNCIQTDLNRGIFLDYLSCSLFLIFWARK